MSLKKRMPKLNLEKNWEVLQRLQTLISCNICNIGNYFILDDSKNV